MIGTFLHETSVVSGGLTRENERINESLTQASIYIGILDTRSLIDPMCPSN